MRIRIFRIFILLPGFHASFIALTHKRCIRRQRAWKGETNPRIGVYDLTAKTWQLMYYPLDLPVSPNGGWVGLSEIAALGSNRFLVLERDNQGGPDARIKRIYRIDLTGKV